MAKGETLMPFAGKVNLVSVFIACLFLLPVASGFLRPLTAEKICRSLFTLLSAGTFAVAAAVSAAAAAAVFAEGNGGALENAVAKVPALYEAVMKQDVLAQALLTLMFLVATNSLLHLVAVPPIGRSLIKLSERLERAVSSAGRAARRLAGAVWKLPRAAFLAAIFSLALNFYAAVAGNTRLREYIGESCVYRFVDRRIIEPLLTSGCARRVPEAVASAVDRAVDCLSSEGRRLLFKVYINGVTVEEAVASCAAIDNTAVDIVDAEADDYRKAQIIYGWIAENVAYDSDKARAIEEDAFSVQSGAVTAFSEKKGVCFDKACLFVAMCRAVDVRVRLITGEAFDGEKWQEHSWNEFFDGKSGRWVEVDATFGGGGRAYFDSPDFYADHRGGEIQGEW